MARTKRFIFSAIIFVLSLPVFSQRLAFDNSGNLGLDFPAGFQLVESNNEGTAFQLQSSLLPVTVVVRIYGSSRYGSSKSALQGSLKSLGAKSELEDFSWRNLDCSIASFSANIGQAVTGYALGSPLPSGNASIVVIAWCPKNQINKCQDFILSLMDGLLIDSGSLYEAGPVTSYLFPKSSNKISVELNVDGKKINTNLRENDNEASEYLIQREYDVLKLYASNKNWKQALERYYRMIFKDSYGRLWQCGFDIFNELFPDCTDDTDLAQKLLTWTQSFEYQREKTESDFASLPSILLGGGSDCDSRSMLLSVLLTQMNQDVVMLVSPSFSHAMAAITSDHPGHSFTFNGKQYIMGETTVPGLTWGIIDGSQDDQSKWMAIFF